MVFKDGYIPCDPTEPRSALFSALLFCTLGDCLGGVFVLEMSGFEFPRSDRIPSRDSNIFRFPEQRNPKLLDSYIRDVMTSGTI